MIIFSNIIYITKVIEGYMICNVIQENKRERAASVGSVGR